MATTTDLIRILGGALGLERCTVDWAARQLRKSGLLPTGKGGRDGKGAAGVSPEHAANLLVALMVPQPTRGPSRFKSVSGYLSLESAFGARFGTSLIMWVTRGVECVEIIVGGPVPWAMVKFVDREIVFGDVPKGMRNSVVVGGEVLSTLEKLFMGAGSVKSDH